MEKILARWIYTHKILFLMIVLLPIFIVGGIISHFEKPTPPPPPPPPATFSPKVREEITNPIVKANAVLAYMEQETQWKMKDHETLFKEDTAWAVRGTYYNGPIPMVSITVPFGAKYAIIKDLATQQEKKVEIPK